MLQDADGPAARYRQRMALGAGLPRPSPDRRARPSVVRRTALITLVLIGGSLAWTVATNTGRPRPRLSIVPVVVATKDIPQGAIVDRTAVTVALWPVATIPVGAYSSPDSVINRVARINVFRGEALVPGRLAPEGPGAGLEVKITPGKRAYAIRIDDLAALAGLVQPNSRVDILLVPDEPKGSRREAKLVMSNVRVLAIGSTEARSRDARPISAHVVSIEVAPEEVDYLAIAAAQGQLQLLLRGPGDIESPPDVAAGCDPGSNSARGCR